MAFFVAISPRSPVIPFRRKFRQEVPAQNTYLGTAVSGTQDGTKDGTKDGGDSRKEDPGSWLEHVSAAG